jgi:hypothetical protein
MKKIMCVMFCIITSSLTWSQKLYVASDGVVRITPTAFVYAGGDVEIIAGGDLTADSDATNSASFLAPTGTANVTGDISYMRHVNDANWHFVSAPVTTQTAETFAENAVNDIPTSGTKFAVAKYDNGQPKGSRWVYFEDGDAASVLESGKGYSTKRNAAGDHVYTGNMAMDAVTVNVPETVISPNVPSTAGNPGSHLWSVVGNPYPSFIDVAAVLTANAGKLDANYNQLNVWDGSAYVALNYANADKIHPGQAFMLDPATSNTDIVIAESQTHQLSSTDVFQRSAAAPEVVVSLSNGTANRTTALKYFSNTTLGLDSGWDAGSFNIDANFSLDTHLVNDSDGFNFMLQCLPASDYAANVVSLSVNAAANEALTFSATAMNLPAGLNVFLEDRIANTITDITAGSYNVTPTEALSGIGRFYLHTTESALSVGDENVLENSLSLYKTNNTTIRVTGLKAQDNATIKMYSVTGKQVFAKQFVAQNVSDVTLPSLSTGVYIVNVVSNNVELNKKVIIE